MSRELTDAEALAHYRDELNRTRRDIKALADTLSGGGLVAAVKVEDAILRILGERP